MFDLDPNPKYERPISYVDRANIDNWQKLSSETRKRCVEVLHSKTPPDMMETWKRQHSAGLRIGSDDPWFHFGIGMQVRNALRAVLRDDALPEVKYEDGNTYKNWDDFYVGALHELVSEHNSKPEEILFSPVRL